MNRSRNRPPARQRLLAAASTLFARDGLQGATTRAIAQAARVNEVTLFRLFRSKENLLAEVVGRTFDEPAAEPNPVLPPSSGNLRKDLAGYAREYDSRLTANLPLIRTLIGEIHRHRSHERKVADGIFRPLRLELLSCLRELQHRGGLRRDVKPAIAADLLGGMVFAGVLRRSSPNKPSEYAAADYLEACVEVLARGIEARKAR
jgi:AcrR family transcriptional regulator